MKTIDKNQLSLIEETAEAKTRPILFSAAMVRAILADRKTMTRRIMKPQPASYKSIHGRDLGILWAGKHPPATQMPLDEALQYCPHGVVGDRLWVRETWLSFQELYFYRATDLGELPDSLLQFSDSPKWKPSIFMPRQASRITLEITGVRTERLQEMSEGDAIAEGIDEFSYGEEGLNFEIKGQSTREPVKAFEYLWDSINGEKYSWESNPWVWVIEFKRVEP